MNKINILLLLFTFNFAFSQVIEKGNDNKLSEFKYEEKAIIKVFRSPNKNKSELFSSINKWIALNYNSPENVIQMNDKESGHIVVKGTNTAPYINLKTFLYPKNKSIPKSISSNFNHSIEIDIKEDKYRVTYKITDIIQENKRSNYLLFNCVNFIEKNNFSINAYRNYTEVLLKQGMYGKKKTAVLLSNVDLMIDELNKNLLKSMENTVLSIEKFVVKDDKW